MFSAELGREVKKDTMDSGEHNEEGKPLSFPVLNRQTQKLLACDLGQIT